tara:strand:- start:40320 stop:40526 length:207 start_codon:yes stop_codon:yes gene_type:complete
LVAERLAVGVLPRAVREVGAMLGDCCELEAACVEAIEDDEFLGRAVAGGVERFRSMIPRTATRENEQY